MDPSVGLAHVAESTAAHCFVTVDLDLNAGYVRFFRNGHLIGTAFQGLTGNIAPALGFIQVRWGSDVVSPGLLVLPSFSLGLQTAKFTYL